MDESEASHGHNIVHEHRTTRAKNIYLVDDVRESGHTLRMSGSSINAIREESRCIWMFNDTPGIFFDLEQSETFNRMCADEKPLELEEYLFMEKDLSLDDVDNPVDLDFGEGSATIEERIDTSIRHFQRDVMKTVSKTVAHTSNSFGGQAYPVALSGAILKELDGLIHEKEFLIQQNRDLYRELCDHSCRGMRDSSQATFIGTKWCQDLNDSLDANRYGVSHGVNTPMLAGVIEQLILNLRTHHRMEIERGKNKEYRKYTRGVVKKARDDMRVEIKNAWRANLGDDEEIVTKRDMILNNIQKEFYYKTNWTKMKFDFDLSHGGGAKTSEDKQRINDAKQEFEREFKDNERRKEFERQNNVDEMAENSEKRARERNKQQTIDEIHSKNIVKDAFVGVVAINPKSSRSSIFDNRYTAFCSFVRLQYSAQITNQYIKQQLTNKCENECVNEILKYVDEMATETSTRVLLRQSVERMHQNIKHCLLDADFSVIDGNLENIESYFDNRVYERTRNFTLQDLNITQRKNRIENQKIIMDEFEIMFCDRMDKHYARHPSETSLSTLNYNPYVI